MLTQNYTIDMIPSGVPLTLHVTQYDVGMTQFVFTPFTSNGVLDLSTATSANIEATKSDGYAVVHPCTLGADKTATYVLKEQLAAVEGLVYSKLVYRDATGKALASKAIVWRVAMAGVTDESVVSDSDIPLLEQAIQMGTVVTDALANIDERIAEQVSQMQVKEGQTVIDATLTVSGAAADAKATGDRFEEVDNTIAEHLPVNSVTGNPAAFADGANDTEVENLVLNIEPHQSGSGDPSPTNVRPITGYTAVNVTRVGKNLLPNGAVSQTIQGVTFTVNSDGTVTVNGTNTGSSTASFYIHSPSQTTNNFSLDAGNYILSGCPSGGGASTYFMSLYYNRGGGNNWNKFDFGSGQTYTLTNSSNTGLGVRIGIAAGKTVNNLVFKPMLRLASITDSTYEPYQATTYPISLASAGTVYGGTLDVKSGKLTVDKVLKQFTNTGTWYLRTDTNWENLFYTAFTAPGLGRIQSGGIGNECYCDKYKMVKSDIGTLPNGSAIFNSQIISSSQNTFAVRDTRFSTVEDFKASFSTIDVVYPLATPLTYQLTPTEVTTLLGYNTIWMDADGTLDIDYRADVQLYVDERDKRIKALIAPVEDSYTATRNYTVGSYVIVEDTLYKVTAAIASGGTITPNTNVTATTVMAQIMALA